MSDDPYVVNRLLFYELHTQALRLLGDMPVQNWDEVETSCAKLRFIVQKMHSLAFEQYAEEK